MGGTEVARTNHKMKSVTLSSTESEIVSIVDASTYIRYLIHLFQELGVPVETPVTVRQDNQSAIHMVKQGCTFKKSKHMVIKTHFARGLIEDFYMKLEYTPTEEMWADAYTKHYHGAQLVRYTVWIFCRAE